MFFTIGETASGFFGGTITIGEFGNHNYGSSGYYLNNYREAYLTKAYNASPTMELYIFGFDQKNPSVSISYSYQSAYGGNTEYNMKCYVNNNKDVYYKGSGKNQQFPSNKWGIWLVDFGGADLGINSCPSVTKKHNGIYTFKTTYKGKTYTSILHLKLSE
ncbi:hypothetical protein IO389_001519 [Campylobacter lari]|nr:hypothetical protein [Campylobacter lari]